VFQPVIDPTYESWHAAARGLLAAGVPPTEVVWTSKDADQPVFGELTTAPPAERSVRFTVPRKFVDMAKLVASHTDDRRWSLLYRLLWRIVRENRDVLGDELDPDVSRLQQMAREIRKDVERMKAFVRFRSVGASGSEYFVAWHRPDHDVAGLVAPHFAERYPNMRWSIFTPQTSVHWDGRSLTRDRGVAAADIPREDSNEAAEALWRTYYAAAFNPARANASKLDRDMPKRFRETLPEAATIPLLLADAPARTERLRGASGGTTERARVPQTGDIDALRDAARTCTGCDLYRHAAQTVFGEGTATASIVLVGEQPGDVEDRRGRPFVGPAGELLDRALQAAGIVRSEVYVTNAVKHFAWEPRGKRRIHRTPRLSEMQACRPWLEAELAAIRPRVIVCMGATAARALLGPQAQVNALRGRVITDQSWAPRIVVTLHPAAVLRAQDPASQDASYASLVSDLELARRSSLNPGSRL
jgi:DNA polymerase